jgi:hypothetical protein
MGPDNTPLVPRVVEAAPIIKYMVGWHLLDVTKYCEGNGWRIEA